MFSAYMPLHHTGKGREILASCSLADNTTIKRTVLKSSVSSIFLYYVIPFFSKPYNIIIIVALWKNEWRM